MDSYEFDTSSTEHNPLLERGGGWDECGLVESLDRKGFTSNKSCCELIANSIDAQATQIIWKMCPTDNTIRLIDDGVGMDGERLRDMFKMFKSNNSDRKSMGVSGLGGKEGSYILSKQPNKEPTDVIIYTHTRDGPYSKVITPWKQIFEEKKYTGKIIFTEMSQSEIETFKEDRKECQFKHGTTIVFKYNDVLKQLIETQFSKQDMCVMKMPTNDRWDIIFGATSSTEIILDKSDGTQPIILQKYDYFSGSDSEFYPGKSIDVINHYIDADNEDRYIFSEYDGEIEIPKNGKNGYKTTPSDVSIHQTWKNIGSYEVYNGMRIDERIFDHKIPRRLDSATAFINQYDAEYFIGDVEYNKDCLSGCSVRRNKQYITKILFAGKYNAKTSRGNGDAMLKSFHHRTEIRYTTFSNQDNRMDKTIGIQENKNQNQNNLPIPLERLITYLKSKDIGRLEKYFTDVIAAKQAVNAAKQAEKIENDRILNEIKKEKERLDEIERKRIETEKKRIETEKKRIETEKKQIETEQKRIETEKKQIAAKQEEDVSDDKKQEEDDVYDVAKQEEDVSDVAKQEEDVSDVAKQSVDDSDDEEQDDDDDSDDEEQEEDDSVAAKQDDDESVDEKTELTNILRQKIVDALRGKNYEILTKIDNFINNN